MKLRSRLTPQFGYFFGSAVLDGWAGCVEVDGVVGLTGGDPAAPAGDFGSGGAAAPFGLDGGVGGFAGVGCVSLCAISSTSKISSDLGGICRCPFSPYPS